MCGGMFAVMGVGAVTWVWELYHRCGGCMGVGDVTVLRCLTWVLGL